MSLKGLMALLGFAFVAAWIGFGFGKAILCLLGAGLFAAIAAVAQGEVDLADVQDRLRGTRAPAPGTAAPPPRVR